MADPPWNINQQGKRGAASHYDLMTLDDIKNMQELIVTRSSKDETEVSYTSAPEIRIKKLLQQREEYGAR